jgi:hypothetical protein
VTVHKISDAERQKWVEKTSPLFKTFGEKSPKTAEMIEKIRALA